MGNRSHICQSTLRSSTAAVAWRPQSEFAYAVNSARELDLLNARAGIAVKLEPLFKSPVGIDFSGSQSEGLSIWKTTAKFGSRTIPKLSANLVSIRFIHSGFVTRDDVGGSTLSAGYGQGMLTWFDVMENELISAGSSTVTATLPLEKITEACRLLDGQQSEKIPLFQPIVDVNSIGLRALRKNIMLIRDRLAAASMQNDMITSLMEEVIVYQLISTWPTSDGRLETSMPDLTSRAIRLAIDFIEENLGRQIRVADIAAAAGQNVRSLQAGFKKRVDCTLIEYLIGRRLDRVHQALQCSTDRSIRSIASEWGFVHMSDFSQRYRQRFGLSPSATRVRTR